LTQALTGPIIDPDAGPSGVSPNVGAGGALSSDPDHARIKRLVGLVSLRHVGASAAGVFVEVHIHANRWRQLPRPAFLENRTMPASTVQLT